MQALHHFAMRNHLLKIRSDIAFHSLPVKLVGNGEAK